MDQLENKFNGLADLEMNEPLAKHTTFKIGGNAKYFLYPKNEINLLRILEICKQEQLEYKIIGKGSNLLWSDENFDGVVICLDRHFNNFNFEADGTIIAQAGVSLILLAHEAMKEGFKGMEFACGIPATIGGALFMNAGAYNSNMSEIVESVYVLRNGICEWVAKEELAYGYRTSIFKSNRDWTILGCKLKLELGNQIEIKELMDSRRKRRLDSQPLNYPNAGSVFRNAGNYPAWSLIEQIGYRGLQVGGAQVSEKHANFIVNVEQASAKDVLTLVQKIQEEVKKQFDIDLKMEVETFPCIK